MHARYKNALMWALYGLLTMSTLIIQDGFLGQVRYFDTKISLLPVVIACIAMQAGTEAGGIFGLCAGTFWCLSGADGGGMLIALSTLCALAAGFLCERYFNRNFLSAAMMCLMALIVMQTVLFLLKYYLGLAGNEGWLVLLKQIFLSMPALAPVYAVVWLIRKVGA